MLWALWPRWLTSKGLPLLGAVQLQKREKRGPQWKQWRVKYLIFLGGVDRRSSGSPVRCGDWGQPRECIWIWARTNLLQITWQSLENLAKQ